MSRLYGVGGNGLMTYQTPETALIRAEYAAGCRLWLVEPGWDSLQPHSATDWSTGAIAALQSKIDLLISLGPDSRIVLDLGLQYPPAWAARLDPLQDQAGRSWAPAADGTRPAWYNGGGANVYAPGPTREAAAGYLQRLIRALRWTDPSGISRLWAARLGPYRGELMWPEYAPSGQPSYWVYNASVQAMLPTAVQGWRPGGSTTSGQATAFYHAVVDRLLHTLDWLSGVLRPVLPAGTLLAPVWPGMGVSPATVAAVCSARMLGGPPWMGTGTAYQQLYAGLPAGVGLTWCSGLCDGTGSNETTTNPYGGWSCAHLHASLAHAAGRAIIGENAGRNCAHEGQCGRSPRTSLDWARGALTRWDYAGLIWMHSGDFAADTICNAQLADLEAAIAGGTSGAP